MTLSLVLWFTHSFPSHFLTMTLSLVLWFTHRCPSHFENDPILTEAAETTIRENDIIFELVSVFEQLNEISSAHISVT